ncbi:phenylalanine--tRNA ligase subunit beta [Leptospira sp. 2 VSF19]|uniref:Phenylalanine--tRNA ligase beta subunit n=1 Tax=Leptospira soteropolitanensis TaxID=2950025 RepID=A0AAW5VG97_9LEPT|nr:phenylalanine--tRNA ligase subunit beta [Leptospira soteropolitanensis]MCW7491842.1 phenylalanine--tRNA ligase subunit beta [Leptospira soteropolitanensis]MCW7499426.1 phenylalanine--tRNA ligase subunit beta [Leptospira soteropolitanensis]MCW7520983.1 phenylalanine--tRNA ligase subunit beta [Leptospira soteropolitanensis]MCW7525530.1 phenylalanine--tRNA ligase subunit beta [Leptospira soteropolitanensis]MCW7529396.1 phenylalanine--tRNA ligase subunit beta [Leptospira soteropolitanensis]
MKLSVDWLNEFTPLSQVPFEKVLEKINTSICEIDDVEEFKVHLSSVITVKIKSLEKHPNAEKLQTTIATDGSKDYQIVTAATNVKAGDIVPLALPGTKLDGKEILDSELRGVRSQGMYCSEKELGLALESSGVLIFPENTTIGISVRKLFLWEDTILTIDNKSITHRPDLWNHFGFARELASQLRLPLNDFPFRADIKFESGNDGLSVTTTDHAHAYYVCSIQDVNITPSNPKIKSRLEKCGIRSINNVVDVSNYLLLELGQPTHFFDRDRLQSTTFSVVKSKEGDSFPLLDDTTPKLQKDLLLIQNGKDPVALAGVMGGKDSAVIDSTKNIVMESAVFKREDVRYTIRKTNIRTESAVRYEKGLDSFTCLPVIKRAVQLLKENGNPKIKVFEPQGFNHTESKSVTIKTNLTFLRHKLGKNISQEEVTEILKRLGFTVANQGEELSVLVPKYRQNYDVTIPEDLVEEIGRTIGYASIQTQALSMAVETPIRNPLRELERRVKNFLALEIGFNEVYNYSFASPTDAKLEEAHESSSLKIANEMPDEHSLLRNSLYPGLIKQAKLNQDRFDSVNLFELGRTYHKEKNGPELAEERRWISILSLSKNKPNDLTAVELEFLQLRETISELFQYLNLPNFQWSKTSRNYFHPNAGLILSYGEAEIAELGILHTRYADEYDLKRRAILSKINMELLVEIWEKLGRISHFVPPSNFPQGQLDLSLLMNEKESTESFADLVKTMKIPELKSVFVQTIFRGDSVGEGKKSVTYRFQLMSYDKTFTQERFKELSDSLVEAAKKNGFNLR